MTGVEPCGGGRAKHMERHPQKLATISSSIEVVLVLNHRVHSKVSCRGHGGVAQGRGRGPSDSEPGPLPASPRFRLGAHVPLAYEDAG